MNTKTIDELRAEYVSLAHAMQSGVAFDQARGSNDGSPKHLRTGVNSAHVSIDALYQLMLSKGLITEREYLTALVGAMRTEVERYERLIGNGVKLV